MTRLYVSEKWIVSGALAAVLIAFAFGAQAQMPKTMTATEKPQEFKDVGIKENLGTTLNLDEQVRDENGNLVPLRSFFGKRPVIFSPVYFSCPGLCNFHLNGLTEALKSLDWSVGQKFDVVAMSFDSHEGADLAKMKKHNYLGVYDRAGTENGWHFVTADEPTVKRIMTQLGFSYRWDEEQKQWAHASAAILISPDGKISRYLHGIMFDPETLKMGINEAGQGKVGTFVDKMIWYCFHYDPHQSKYVLYAMRLVQLGGALMIVLLGLLLVPAWKKNRRTGV